MELSDARKHGGQDERARSSWQFIAQKPLACTIKAVTPSKLPIARRTTPFRFACQGKRCSLQPAYAREAHHATWMPITPGVVPSNAMVLIAHPFLNLLLSLLRGSVLFVDADTQKAGNRLAEPAVEIERISRLVIRCVSH